MAHVSSKPAEAPVGSRNSSFDQNLNRLVRSLDKSSRNIEKSMNFLRGIAQAEAIYRSVAGEVVSGSTRRRD